MTGLAQRLVAVARAAIADCDGALLVADFLAPRVEWEDSTCFVCGAGKAVGAMAEGAWSVLAGRAAPGPLVGKRGAAGRALPPELTAHLLLAGHPLVDEDSVRATEALLAFAAARRPNETLLVLLSGGASSLIGAPLEVERFPIPLAAWRTANERLLASGLPIAAINTVRRHVGRALGGRLALGTCARIEILALSDVIGDDPATIGSGPATADPSTFAAALVIARAAALPDEIVRFLDAGAHGAIEDTPRPGDPRLARVRHRLVGSPRTLLARAEARVREAGLIPRVEPRLVDGDVAELAARYAERMAALGGSEVLIAVGEPTVRVRGRGLGGRAQQLALDMALRLADTEAAFVALGSDGSDGPSDAAGAVVDGATAKELRRTGVDALRALAENDAYLPLRGAGALVITGGTGTNLLDLHLGAARAR